MSFKDDPYLDYFMTKMQHKKKLNKKKTIPGEVADRSIKVVAWDSVISAPLNI